MLERVTQSTHNAKGPESQDKVKKVRELLNKQLKSRVMAVVLLLRMK